MLNRVAFVSALTEGLTTVIPMQIDEIETVYHIVDDYLQENFPGFSTELSHEENDENTKINTEEYINSLYILIKCIGDKIYEIDDYDDKKNQFKNFSKDKELTSKGKFKFMDICDLLKK